MVTVKATHAILPAEPTPNEIMYLSELDQIKAVTHAPTVYFFRPSTDLIFSDAIQNLKDSFSKVLVLFYPLAGRLHEIGGGRLELHCNSKGAILVEAESESKIDDFELQNFLPNAETRELIPKLDYRATPIHEQPLVLVQLTKFSCGGISLGLGNSHVLADGPAALHFVREWARFARCEKIDNVPFLDKRVLQTAEPTISSKFDHTVLLTQPPLLVGQSNNMEERKKPTTVAMLTLSKERIGELKSKANEDTSYKNTTRPYSRYEAVAGHMWRCASKARGHVNNQLTRLHIPVDFRNRMQPPLPQDYFGNANLRQAAMTTAGELLSNPLAYASSKIREAIENVTDEYVRSYLALIKNLPDVSIHRNFHTVGCALGGFFGNPNMEITSWTAMSIYDADFGLGKLIHMGPAVMGFDGKSFIVPGREGSVTVALCLQTEHMDTFKKLFYEEL
ncbi:spermidine hydroxycinnamoyl transferase-like [Olea europaea subsp. europaea]|uniref:Spermidine hydroxycinnamoyl transferase-like n=1 Tax=Olea europaea subsp. europaea TaxID=158383 RepID=A0A8S0UM60_OLEEU|nr:spermidine hydroxycinnamoyl transferase-like [Olea europaea subsp. europaea]CAA3018158.1 spermidine hydroxycinnamoyl transferase-like [Olea europaea subsp. europaea]